eukprot:3250687-Pyramimonas_sp.AAC.1
MASRELPFSESFWDALRDLIRNGAPPAWQSAVLKTIVGGWLTSARLHSSEIGLCRFKCAQRRDDMLHYLHCPVLWRLVYHPDSPPD